MTHENGFLIVHVKRGTFDFLLDGSLTTVEWAKIMLQVMQRLKEQEKVIGKDKPVGMSAFRPEGMDERLRKSTR